MPYPRKLVKTWPPECLLHNLTTENFTMLRPHPLTLPPPPLLPPQSVPALQDLVLPPHFRRSESHSHCGLHLALLVSIVASYLGTVIGAMTDECGFALTPDQTPWATNREFCTSAGAAEPPNTLKRFQRGLQISPHHCLHRPSPLLVPAALPYHSTPGRDVRRGPADANDDVGSATRARGLRITKCHPQCSS